MGQFNDDLRADSTERHSITTKIGSRTVTLFAPPLTGLDLDKIMARHKDFASKPTIAATVDMFVMKVETEDGEKAFDLADKPFLMKRPLSWINTVRSALFPDDDTDLSDEAIEESEKN